METRIFPQTQDGKAKSYWSKPDGKIGIILLLGAVAAGAYYLLPILTAIVWNTINFGIACLAAFVLYTLVSNKQLRLGFFYAYQALVKKFVGLVIQLDPFIIAEDYIQDIEKERENLYNKSVEVDGQKESLDAKIKEKTDEKQRQLNRAEAAKKSGETMELANTARQIDRLDAYVKQLIPIRDNLTKIGNYLTAVHKNSKFMVDDMRNDLELKKDLYKSVTKGNNALQSALSIFKGNPEKKMMLEQSMDYLKDDIANKLASMKKAISYSSDFMKSIDLDNASYEVEGLKMLEGYKPELFTFTDKDGTKVATPAPASIGKINSNQYENLIN